METNLGRLILYSILVFIGLQMLFESPGFEKDFEVVSKVPLLAAYIITIIKISGVFLIFSGFIVVLFNQKAFEKFLFAVLFFSVATIYNPAIMNYNTRSLINVSLIGGLALQKGGKTKDKVQ